MLGQEDVDEIFESILQCELLLDDVIVKLADVGIVIAPEQRMVVSRWLDMFSIRSPIPLGYRLSMLRGMLQA
jgi:hypothetical protein